MSQTKSIHIISRHIVELVDLLASWLHYLHMCIVQL